MRAFSVTFAQNCPLMRGCWFQIVTRMGIQTQRDRYIDLQPSWISSGVGFYLCPRCTDCAGQVSRAVCNLCIQLPTTAPDVSALEMTCRAPHGAQHEAQSLSDTTADVAPTHLVAKEPKIDLGRLAHLNRICLSCRPRFPGSRAMNLLSGKPR